jgi:hypothetical protein
MSRRDDASEDRRLVVPIATCVAVLCFLFVLHLGTKAAQKSSSTGLHGRRGAAAQVAFCFERVALKKSDAGLASKPSARARTQSARPADASTRAV